MAKEKDNLLNNEGISNKIINAFNEYLRFVEGLLNEGLVFEKRVTKFSKTSAAIYLPKRLIGRTFRVLLIPIDDPYELSQIVSPVKDTDKLIEETEKQVEKIQKETQPQPPKVKNLLEI